MKIKSLFLTMALSAVASSSALAQSATIHHSSNGPYLKVQGTGSSDRIWVYNYGSQTRVLIRSKTTNALLLYKTFPTSSISYLRVFARSGDDVIYNMTYLTAHLFGEYGNDSIYGGSGSDLIYAGSGNDYISAGADNDSVYGESGNDTIHGGSGNDNLDGGWGNDSVFGQDGNDRLAGGDGRDYLDGQGGSDTISGGFLGTYNDDGDADTMIGGGGWDYFHFEAIDKRVGVHGTPGNLSVAGKWWLGVEPWIYGPYDSPPKSDPRGIFSPVRFWQCAG